MSTLTIVTSGYASAVADSANVTATLANTVAFKANTVANQANTLATTLNINLATTIIVANQANTTAQTANTVANQANTTAQTANTVANQAINLTILPNLIFISSLVSNLTIQSNLVVTGTIGIGTQNTTVIGSNVNIGTTGSNLSIQGVVNPVGFGGALSDETSTLTTTNQLNIRSPYQMTIRQTYAPIFSLNILPTATTPTTFDILKNGNTIYTVKPTIAAGAAANSSQNGTLIGGSNSIKVGDLLTSIVSIVGSGTPTGAKVYIFNS